jgi:hypothetical protein
MKIRWKLDKYRRETYELEDLTEEIREYLCSFPKGRPLLFSKCERCGYENESGDKGSVRLYQRYKKTLCDACVDSLDGCRWRNQDGSFKYE